MDNDEIYWYWLCNLKDVWRGTISAILRDFGEPKNFFFAGEREIITWIQERNNECNKKPMIKKNIFVNRRNREFLLREVDKNKKKGIFFISCQNDKFPDKLRNINDMPFGLFFRGKVEYLDKLNDRALAIVGARNCTEYGKALSRRAGFEMGVCGINIVSGMARGIDTEGLYGCLEGGGFPVAVLGNGVDVCYPRENIDLYEKIRENGLLVSEYRIGAPPLAWQFPMRNRIISGLADKVLVTEAKKKSGSLITVDFALEQGKDILAVPGRASDILSEGCNELIKQGAAMITEPKDLCSEFEVDIYNKFEFYKNKNNALEKDLETLYSCVDLLPKSIECLKVESGLEESKFYSSLLSLQMMNLIVEPTKNYYVRKR